MFKERGHLMREAARKDIESLSLNAVKNAAVRSCNPCAPKHAGKRKWPEQLDFSVHRRRQQLDVPEPPHKLIKNKPQRRGRAGLKVHKDT